MKLTVSELMSLSLASRIFGYVGSSGKASLTPLRARNSEYTPRIVTVGRNDIESVIMDNARNLRLGIINKIFLRTFLLSLLYAGVRGRCSVHLINEGITSADGGVVIEWGLSAPSDAVKSEIGFQCSLDGGPMLNCKIIKHF